MAQLARMDLMRDRTTPGGSPGSVAGSHQLSAASRLPSTLAYSAVLSLPTRQVSGDVALQPVPGWTVISAALCPILLVGGWLVGGAVQPPSYSPLEQTMSVLAGQMGTDRWIMTTALFLVGVTQLVTATGLRTVGIPARLLLVGTGLCTFGVASVPEAASGPTPVHLALAAGCVFSTAIWPIFVARSPAPCWAVSVGGCLAVTALFAALSGWVLYASFAGRDLGLAERVTSTALGLFPLIVVLSLRLVPAERHVRRSCSSWVAYHCNS